MLDLATLHVATVLSRIAFLLVFTMSAVRQPHEACLRHWIGSILCAIVASIMTSRLPMTRELSGLVGFIIYGLYAACLLLSWSGLRLFNQRATSLTLIVLLAIVPSIVNTICIELLARAAPRTAVSAVFLCFTIYAALATREALHQPEGQQLWSRYLIAAPFAVYTAGFALTLGIAIAWHVDLHSPESARLSMLIDQFAGVLIDVGFIAMANERATLQLRRLAETDTLTGLFNRRGLYAALAAWGDQSRTTSTTGVLLADLDDFKAINDLYGHDAGDAVLVSFAARLRQALRRHDIVVRWGGEEFLAILPDTDLALIASLAERLRGAVAATPFLLPDGRTIAVTVSIGVTETDSNLSDFENAARRADAALYEAKHKGRNQICGAPAPAPAPDADRPAPFGFAA